MLEDRRILSRAPLDILVNPDAIKYQKPWQVDLVVLLNLLIDLIGKTSSIDLRICGSAILSSALLYRLKVETLFAFEKLRTDKKGSVPFEPPGFISVPFRYELYTTDIEDLIQSLRKIIEEILDSEKVEKRTSVVIEPETTFEIDRFLIRIEEMLSPFRLRLMNLLREKGELLFSEYVLGMGKIEQARSFILLLFLAMEGLVYLEQLEEDIRIRGRS